MTPTLMGRMQTRLFLLATVGVAWTLLVGPVLPRSGGELSDIYRATFLALLLVGLVGIAWECLYQFVQQYRWEKDWPILFGLLQGIPEGLIAYVLVDALIDGGVPGWTFTIHFFTTWVLVWLVANGPMRVVSLRWRYGGGRVV